MDRPEFFLIDDFRIEFHDNPAKKKSNPAPQSKLARKHFYRQKPCAKSISTSLSNLISLYEALSCSAKD